MWTLGFEGMKEEIGNLEKCGAGKVIGQAEVDALKKKHPLMRVILSRWVSAYKSESRVRVRIVAKDLNKGISARKLGISSPTPSIEGFFPSNAFMASARSFNTFNCML